MIKITRSLRHWLFVNHPDILPLVMFGHLELITDDMYQKYLDWCKTTEGTKYLKDRSNCVKTKGE